MRIAAAVRFSFGLNAPLLFPVLLNIVVFVTRLSQIEYLRFSHSRSTIRMIYWVQFIQLFPTQERTIDMMPTGLICFMQEDKA